MVDFKQNKELRAAVPLWLKENERSWAWMARKIGVSRSLFTHWVREDCNISKEKLDRVESIIHSKEE